MRRSTATLATLLLASGAGLAAGSQAFAADRSGAALSSANPSTSVRKAAAAPAATPRWVRATLHSSSGTYVGRAWLRDTSAGTVVRVEAKWLKPGFHGLHVHAIGKCEKKSADPTDATKVGAFLSAGGHVAIGNQVHPNHAGDLPALYAKKNTRASTMFTTDRFKVADLLDANGSALMIHQGADNYANVPKRYDPKGPDAETKKTGDAGSRAACGVLKR